MRSGLGSIAVARVGARSVVASAHAASPLHLLLPNNHGHAAWVYATSFGGGLVDGDHLALDVSVRSGATAFLTTQASTKVYGPRREQPSATGTRQSLEGHVEEGALLAVVPDAVVCFAGARFGQATDVRLEAGASLVLVELLSAGRRARGERWAFARCTSRIRVACSGVPVLSDALELDSAHGSIGARMGKLDALATLVAVGPRTADLREGMLRGARDGLSRGAPLGPCLLSASSLEDDAAMARLGGESLEEVLRVLRRLLGPLVDALGDDPFARKW